MTTIDISIGHDDDFVISNLACIKFWINATTDSGNHISDFSISENTFCLSFFNVKNLTTQWKNGLRFSISTVFSTTTSGITFDDI